MRIPLNINKIVALQKNFTALWHKKNNVNFAKYKNIYNLIIQLHFYNFTLWHLEDKARNPKVSDKIIANVKKEIDKNNQLRNDTIEKIDFFIDAYLKKNNIQAEENTTVNTETPGAAIDRLSILALKIYHMNEEISRDDVSIEHIKNCNNKLFILKEQKINLVKSLTQLIKDIFFGQKRHIVYRQFKMYNDPTLNPEIYKISKRKLKLL